MHLFEKARLIKELLESGADVTIRDYLAEVRKADELPKRIQKMRSALITPFRVWPYKYPQPTKYTSEVRQFVADNINSMNLITLAAKVKTTPVALRKQICVWRNEGHDMGVEKYTRIKIQK